MPHPNSWIRKRKNSWRLTLIAVTMCSLQYFICTLSHFQTKILKKLTTMLMANTGSVLSIWCILKEEQRRITIVDNFALELARDLIQIPIERRTSPLQKRTRMLSFILNRWWSMITWRTPGWLPVIVCVEKRSHDCQDSTYLCMWSDHQVILWFFLYNKEPYPTQIRESESRKIAGDLP